jgi:hypothetical protein
MEQNHQYIKVDKSLWHFERDISRLNVSPFSEGIKIWKAKVA